jgi:hypothetical protein
MKNEKIAQYIKENVNIENLEILDYITDFENISSFEELYEELDDNRAFEVEIIFFSEAINYLKEEDPSLKESLEIAEEYGYSLSGLSSEVLASLLASQRVRENFKRYEDELNEILSEC